MSAHRKNKRIHLARQISLLFLFISAFFLYQLPQIKQFFSDQLGVTKSVKAATCHLSGDIMLITDISDSMKGASLQAAVNGAKSFVDIVTSNNSPIANDRVGLTTFSWNSTLDSPLTSNYNSVKNALDNIGKTGLNTCLSCGVNTAANEIKTNGRSGVAKIGILLTDGIANAVDGWPKNHSQDNAAGETDGNKAVDNAYGANGMIFYTIGLGPKVNHNYLQNIADRTGGIYYFSPGLGQLQTIYQDISQQCPQGFPPVSGPPLSGSPTSYPTLTPPPAGKRSISGDIYVDFINNGNYTAPPDKLYTDSISIIDVYDNSDNKVTETQTATGQYATDTLDAGTYTVSYTSLPSGYFMTYPRNGPPPSFKVTVGSGCNPGNQNDGYCVSGSARGVNFGITNIKPWYQSFSGDLRIDGNMSNAGVVSSGVNDPIPLNPSCGGAAPAAYVIAPNGSQPPGIIFSGSSSYDFGYGSASTNNYVAGGNSLYPETFKQVNTGVMRTSYQYMIDTAKQAGITPTDLSSKCTIANCWLPNNFKHGLFLSNGNLYLNTFDVPKNNDYVLLVNGDLHIQGNITMPVNSHATFTISAKGTIYIDPTVGNIDATDTTANMAGFYSADKSFIIQSAISSCTTGASDKRLNIEGAVVTNAALGNPAGSFQNNRDLCINNFYCPAVTFIQRPDLVIGAPAFIKHSTSIFQEVAP